MSEAIRCPRCGRKLAEDLIDGILKIKCRRCNEMVWVDRRVRVPVE